MGRERCRPPLGSAGCQPAVLGSLPRTKNFTGALRRLLAASCRELQAGSLCSPIPRSGGLRPPLLDSRGNAPRNQRGPHVGRYSFISKPITPEKLAESIGNTRRPNEFTTLL